MKKLMRILMMMLVLAVGTGITSCDEIEGMVDNPVVPEPAPQPQPQPQTQPQPTPEEIEAQRIAEAKALLEESRQEGALVKLTYTVNGVEQVAAFKRVGDKFELQTPSATRADGSVDDEWEPYLIDYDTDEDPEDDQDLDEADLDKDIEEEFESVDDDDDDDDLDDDDIEDLENDAYSDLLEWEDIDDEEDADDDEDDADDDDEDADDEAAGTRAATGISPSHINMMVGFRSKSTLADCTQALLITRKATFTQDFATVETPKTRGQEAVRAFTGKIEVNGKTFTYQDSEAATRASKTVKVKQSGKLRITQVVFKAVKKLTYKKSKTMQVQVLPRNAEVKKVKWKVDSKLTLSKATATSNNKNVISKCKVTPKKIGKNYIIKCTATGKNTKTKAYKVKVVYADVKKVKLDKGSLTFTVGDRPQQLTATVEPSNADPKVIITWESSDKAVATVDSKGLVTPVAPGTATITAKAGSKTATCTVTVKAAPAPEPEEPTVVPITSLTVSPASLSLLVGATATLSAEVNEDATVDKTITWSVTQGDAVSVDQTGKVTALKAGTATITAEAGTITATCTVTVEDPNSTLAKPDNFNSGDSPF